MRKRRRERIEKETKRQFEEKEGLRDPPLLEFLDPTLRCSSVSSSPQGMTSWSSSIKIRFLQALLKKCHGVTQNAKKCAIGETKFEVFIRELIRRERRDGGEGEERGLRKGAEEIERKRQNGTE